MRLSIAVPLSSLSLIDPKVFFVFNVLIVPCYRGHHSVPPIRSICICRIGRTELSPRTTMQLKCRDLFYSMKLLVDWNIGINREM